jgi:uroporphyrinogen III methyltransferase / synthase
VAVIRWGTMPEQEVLVSTLDNVCYEVTKRDFQPPAVTVIGEVVALRPLIKWVERKPLFGIRAALTRPADQGAALAAALRDAGAEVVITPTIRIEPRPFTESLREKIREIASYEWIVFTSANGVRAFFRCLENTKMDARALHGLHVAAIGERTAEALSSHGIRADVVPREFVQESLAKSIRVAKGDRVLVPRASEARDVLQLSLEKRGAKVTILPVYDTLPDTSGIATLRRQLTRGRIHLCTFTSASTVEKFVESAKAEDIPKFFAEVAIASIGPVTTKALEACGLRADIEATKSTAEGLAEAIIRHYSPRKRSTRSTRS